MGDMLRTEGERVVLGCAGTPLRMGNGCDRLKGTSARLLLGSGSGAALRFGAPVGLRGATRGEEGTLLNWGSPPLRSGVTLLGCRSVTGERPPRIGVPPPLRLPKSGTSISLLGKSSNSFLRID